MRNSSAGWWLATLGAGLLTACADSPVAPVAPVPSTEKATLYASNSSCDGGGVHTRKAAPPSGIAPDVSLRGGWPIAGVTVRANFSGASFGLPFNIMQMMTYQREVHPLPLPCLASAGESYSEVATPEVMAPSPVPDGVDPGWWNALSPREQRALIRFAQVYMQLYPNTYTSVSSVINLVFRDQLLPLKARAKIRAMDFYGGTAQGELLAGGIYGCLLYRSFVTSSSSPFANDEIQELTTSLVSAFAEAHFIGRPLMGLRFGRNGVFGAGLASVDYSNIECGSLVFGAVGGAITIDDPYGNRPNAPGGPGPSGPGDDASKPPGGHGDEDR